METIAFARGVPAHDMIPIAAISAAATEVLDADAPRILSYGTGGGYPPLRDLLAGQHHVSTNRVIVTSGSLQGFALYAQLLRDRHTGPGKPVVIVENPTYDRPLIVLKRLGFEIRSVDLDGNGLDPDALEAALAPGDVTFVYIIPSFQNPAGVTLSDERRERVLTITARAGVPLFEDDPYGQLHFTEPAPTPIFGRRGDDHVTYACSFSKTVSPGLRVGYLVVPDNLAGDLERYANDTYISATLLGQAIVANLIEHQHIGPAIAHARALLHRRSELLAAAIETHLPEAEWHKPTGGYFAWVALPDALDADALLPRATELGVTFVPGSAFGTGHANAMRIAFSSPPIDSIEVGIERLARAASEQLAAV